MGKVLTKIEKLDAEHPGLAITAKMQFDRGTSARKVSAIINEKFPVAVSKSSVSRFRLKVWLPDRERMHQCGLIVKGAVEAFGGDQGIDALASARIFEILMTTKDWTKLTKVRELLCRTRAQALKEQEFLFKSGQLETSEQSDSEGEETAPDGDAMSVVDRIKEIFGISPDPVPQSPPPVEPGATVKEQGSADPVVGSAARNRPEKEN